MKIQPSLNKPMHHWVDRFFHDFNDTFDRAFVTQTPAINVVELQDGFRIELAAPGLVKEDFKLNLEEDVLKISVDKDVDNGTEGETFRRREFSYTSFERSFRLPETVDQAAIAAKYEQGVLNIALPKKEEAKVQPAREIQIG